MQTVKKMLHGYSIVQLKNGKFRIKDGNLFVADFIEGKGWTFYEFDTEEEAIEKVKEFYDTISGRKIR